MVQGESFPVCAKKAIATGSKDIAAMLARAQNPLNLSEKEIEERKYQDLIKKLGNSSVRESEIAARLNAICAGSKYVASDASSVVTCLGKRNRDNLPKKSIAAVNKDKSEHGKDDVVESLAVTRSMRKKDENRTSWAHASSKLRMLKPKDTSLCQKCFKKPHESADILFFVPKFVLFAVERASCSGCKQNLCSGCARICFEQKHKIQSTITCQRIDPKEVHVDNTSVICKPGTEPVSVKRFST